MNLYMSVIKSKWFWIISIPLLLIVILLNIRIKTVVVSGNAWYTGEEIENFIFKDDMSRNTAVCLMNIINKKKVEIPFVQDYSVTITGPFKAEIIVYEKSIVAYVLYMNSRMYFDKDGVVVESSDKVLEEVPLVTGLKFGSVSLYKALPVEDKKVFTEILNLTQILSVYGVHADKIKINSSDETSLTLGEIEVVLGNSENIDGKVAELKDMLPKITGLEGTLYLDTYSVTRDKTTAYTFKKKNTTNAVN